MGKNLKGKELGKNISQRKDGLYVGRFVDRFGKRRALYSKELRELKKALANARHLDALEQNVEYSDMTLEQWFDVWMKGYKEGKVKLSTQTLYRNTFIRYVKPALGRKRLDAIRTVDLNLFFNDLRDRGLAGETISSVRLVLSDMYNKAILDDIVQKNPVRATKVYKRVSHEARVLSIQEQKKFFEYSSGTFYDRMFKVAVSTGLRPGELFALEESDIDFDKKEISVNKTLTYSKFIGNQKTVCHVGDTKTKSGTRKVPINNTVCNILKEQIQKSRMIRENGGSNVPFLFVTRRGSPVTSGIYNSAIRTVVNKINSVEGTETFERFSGHAFRHTFATRCVEAGINYKVLQNILGHATLQMTMDLYVHVLPETKASEMEKVNFFNRQNNT